MRSWFIAAWNGPFYVGKLTRPVYAGDAALKLLEVIWKAAVAVILLAAGAGALLALILWSGPILSPPLSKSIQAVVVYDAKRCPAAYPLVATIYNQSSKMVGSVSFRVAARVPNKSTDLNSSWEAYDNDTVMRPHSYVEACYRLPRLPEDQAPAGLIYTAEVTTAAPYDGPDVTRIPPPPTSASNAAE